MKPLLLAAIAFAAATPAGAVTSVFTLSGAQGSAASYAFTASTGLTLTAQARNYTGTYANEVLQTLGTITAPAATTVYRAPAVTSGSSRTLGGLGVKTGNEGAQQVQVDVTGANEFLLLTPGKASRLVSADFNFVDDNDTLAIFGLKNGVLTKIGYSGEFDVTRRAATSNPGNAPLGVQSVVWGTTANPMGGSGTADNRTWRVTFAPTAQSYDAFYFTNNSREDDGYRLAGLSLAAVPEPATWGTMALGFGLMGIAIRRRRVRVAA